MNRGHCREARGSVGAGQRAEGTRKEPAGPEAKLLEESLCFSQNTMVGMCVFSREAPFLGLRGWGLRLPWGRSQHAQKTASLHTLSLVPAQPTSQIPKSADAQVSHVKILPPTMIHIL
jgi:hypothetical protein